MAYMWLFIIILLVVVEVATVDLTTIWFIASGIAAMIISLFTDNVLIQFGVFALLGAILLITTRPFLKKILVSKDEKTNIDRVIGMTGVVTDDIETESTGEVKVDGKLWTAYAQENILKGEHIKVITLDGVKLKVEKVKE